LVAHFRSIQEAGDMDRHTVTRKLSNTWRFRAPLHLHVSINRLVHCRTEPRREQGARLDHRPDGSRLLVYKYFPVAMGQDPTESCMSPNQSTDLCVQDEGPREQGARLDHRQMKACCLVSTYSCEIPCEILIGCHLMGCNNLIGYCTGL
jgi:hypothetical protein